MPAPASPRLADVVSGPITVTVPWTVVGGDDEGGAASGTATYTIATTTYDQYQTICDDLDRALANGNATVT